MLAIDSHLLVGRSTSDDRDWHGLRRNKLRTATSGTSCTGRSPDCEGTEQLPYGGNEPNKADVRQTVIDMKLLDIPLGLIINFNELKLADGISRLILPGVNME